MNLLLKQEHAVYFLNDEVSNEIIYGGAAGGGKSAIGVLWLIEQCQNFPGTRWLMGRSKLKTLKETTLNTFFQITANLHISDFKYNSQSGTITWSNGSEILLKDLFTYPSDPNFDSLGSLEITGAFIDECNQIDYKAWQIVKSRIRYKLNEYNKIPKMLGTCNPSKNWVYREFYKPHSNKTIKNNRKFIQSLPKDNPHLPKSYIESLRELDSNSRERLLNGNWEYDDDPTRLCEYDDILATFHNDHSPTDKKYITADVARLGSDKAVIGVWDGWNVIDFKVYDLSKLTEIQICINDFRSKYGIPKHQAVADQDGLGAGVVDNCGIKGFVNNAKPMKEEVGEGRTQPNYKNLQTQCGYYLAKMINTHRLNFKCSVPEHYKDEIVEELEQLKSFNSEKDATKVQLLPKDKIKENIGRSPDWRDMLLMRSYFDLKKDDYFIV